jgi:hypothetical protein
MEDHEVIRSFLRRPRFMNIIEKLELYTTQHHRLKLLDALNRKT